MKTNTPAPRTFRGVTAIAFALAALGLRQPAARAAIITTDDTLQLSAGGDQNDASVVGQWTSAKGSAPVDTSNDLLKNHATVSMSAPKLGLGDSLSYINDGSILSGGHTSGQTDGLCLFTSDGAWVGSGPVDVIFTLDARYDIGRIDGFTLWDLSRLGQKYDLYASTDSGTNWNLVTSVSKDATGSDGNRYVRRISLTDSDGVVTGLAGVNALKFHIMDPGPSGAPSNNSIYAEIAAYALVVADAANSTVVAAPTTVASDGTTTSTITVTLRDASNNPVAGKTVTLASSRAEGVDTISAASGPSSSLGLVTFTVKSSTSGSATFTATDVSDSNLVISPSTATVTFEAGAVSAANSMVAADPSSVTANGSATSTITVTLKDASGTAVQGKTVSLVSSRSTPPDTILPTSSVSNLSGVVAFTISSAIAGDATFTATGDSVPITQTAAVTFTPGPVAAGTSTVTASPATATADGIATSTITVTLMDANSNRVAGKDVSLASDRGTPPDTILPASGNTSNANGVATFTVSSATVGSPVFSATGDSVPITDMATVSFVYALPVNDTTVHLLASGGDTNNDVVTKWATAQGSAPVDTVNDLLINHATASMLTGGVALGVLANINDGLQVSTKTTSDTDGMCLFTSNGGWPSSGPADLVFTLDANYDIARIDSFTLWDPSRTGQKYDLYGSTDGGANWTFVTSVNNASGDEGSNRDLRRISLTNAGEVIPGLVGVNALKFHIMDPGPNGATSNNSIYAELAAYEVVHGGSTPTITLEGPLSDVSTTYGTASATPTSFTVVGSNLTGAPGNLTVAALSGYEYCITSGGTYTSTLNLPYTGAALSSTPVYVRLAATADVAGSPYSGDISVSGGGASAKTIATASSTVSKADSIVSTWPTATIAYGQTLGSSTVSGGVATPTGGTYAFTSPSDKPGVGTASHAATYTPAAGDIGNYNPANGSVSVTVTPNFVSWIDGFNWAGFNDPDKSATGDPDKDGLTNEQEYAFGLNPTSSTLCDPITVQLNKTTGKFSYTRTATPAATGITYTVWTSTSLATDGWTLDGSAAQGVTGTANNVETVEVTLTGAPLGDTKLFVRVKAVVPAQ